MCIKRMVKNLDDIVKLEKEYLRTVLGKTIIESDETWPISKYTPYHTDNKTTYKLLAKKYLKCDYKEHRQNIVHHINFNHSDNRLCNLVVLTKDEHQNIHWMFDPSYEEVRQKMSEANTGKTYSDEVRKQRSERMKANNPMRRKDVAEKVSSSLKGRKMSEEAKQKISERTKGKKKSDEFKMICSERANNRKRNEKGLFI